MKLADATERLATEKRQLKIINSKSGHNKTKLLASSNKVLNILDTTSLKVRLTVGIAAVAAIGLGSVAAWTSMRMQHILVSTHIENMKYIADRFPMDVEIYSEMIPLPEGAQRAINSLSTKDKLIWIKNSEGEVTAKSQALNAVEIGSTLLAIKNVPLIPQVRDLNGSYWLMCATPLRVEQVNLGQLYLAHNITKDQIMFFHLIRSLSIATIMALIIMTTVIAIYIHRSMQPLKKISQLTSTISADKLAEAHFNLDRAPSEVRELAETFDNMLVRLSDSWEHQKELLSNVSHELRTPLTIVSGYIQSVLRRGKNLSEVQIEALTTASSEADRTVQLLQDLLDLARVDSHRMQFQMEKVVLNDLTHEIVEMAKQYSDRDINWESSPNLIIIKADKHRLKQVLLNLIDNAVKYSAVGTPIFVKIKQQNNCGIIQVCDRGVGISLQQQGRIFERFFRVDESRNRAGGTGLGLSIVKTLVEGMGGNIQVYSQLNEGSTFTLRFPLV